MPEPPAAREPRRDTTAADASSLERLGRIDPQPVPAPSIAPFQAPTYPGGDWTADEETG